MANEQWLCSMEHDEELASLIGRQGFALARPDVVARAADLSLAELAPMAAYWDDLPPDTQLRDGGHYRSRRHASLRHDLDRRTLELSPPRAHYQPATYNALHGGLERWFEPHAAGLVESSAFTAVIRGLGELFGRVRAPSGATWFVESHLFRIDTAQGVGRPTPEGAHRDGVDFVAIILVDRRAVTGGETRVFEADGPHGVRFALTVPWTALLLDDHRVIHETTPIVGAGDEGHRDTWVLTYREGSFQDRAADQPQTD